MSALRGRRRQGPDGVPLLPILSDMSLIEAFVAIMDMRSITRAAERLGAAPSAISQRLASLERQSRTRLIYRTTRKMAPTEAGERLYRRCKQILALVDSTEEELRGAVSAPVGDLRLSAPLFFGTATLAPLLLDFARAHPGITLTVDYSAQDTDLIADGFDLVIRMVDADRVPDKAERLSTHARLFCAAPAYLERSGLPQVPNDLAAHQCLTPIGREAQAEWPTLVDGRVRHVRVTAALRSNSVQMLVDAARAGLGIALVSRRAASAHLASGELVEVLADFAPPPRAIVAMLAEADYLPKKTSLFVAFLKARLSQA